MADTPMHDSNIQPYSVPWSVSVPAMLVTSIAMVMITSPATVDPYTLLDTD